MARPRARWCCSPILSRSARPCFSSLRKSCIVRFKRWLARNGTGCFA
ncbi:unnamed protein product, partial [Laminaria digitata]